MNWKEEFDNKGYVVLRGAMGKTAVKYYVDAIDALKPNFKKRTWTIPDGVTRHRDFWPVINHEATLEVVRAILGKSARFLQHDDIHFGFSSFAWHRDSVNRKFGDFPNWDETEEPYKILRVGYYFQHANGGFRLGMVPGSHRPQIHYDKSHMRRIEQKITDLANVTAKASGVDRLSEDAEWIATQPGDAIIFDPRVIHTGSKFDGDKYSVFVAYGQVNRHYQEHYQYYRYLRKDLKYQAMDPQLVEILKGQDLYGGEGQTLDAIDGAWIPSDVFNYFSSFFK
jgi:hypothetical protein